MHVGPLHIARLLTEALVIYFQIRKQKLTENRSAGTIYSKSSRNESGYDITKYFLTCFYSKLYLFVNLKGILSVTVF